MIRYPTTTATTQVAAKIYKVIGVADLCAWILVEMEVEGPAQAAKPVEENKPEAMVCNIILSLIIEYPPM